MADFGLAAQIGRGGAGGGMPPQVDPINRMTQMMQLQQLQQNMMLAQELAGRQRELQPLLLQEKREGIQTEVARRGLVGEQTGRAREERQSAERAGLAERGALEYISATPPELRADPARLDVLRKANPGAYTTMMDTIAKAKALQEKARAEGFSADEAQFKFNQLRLGSMSSLLPGVTEQTWPTVYNEFKSADPLGARVVGPEFDPKNVDALRARVQNLSDLRYEKDEQGYEYILNMRTGEKTPVVKRGVNPPAQSTFGALDQNAQTSSPQLIGQGATGVASPNAMQPPGAAPIIQPRAAGPEAAGLSPAAAAAAEKKTAELQATSAASDVARRKGAAEVLGAISSPDIEKLILKSTSGIGQKVFSSVLGAAGVGTSGTEATGQLDTIAGDLVMRVLGGKLGGGISNSDVVLIKDTLADISNPYKPANQRLAAFRQLKKNLESIASGKPIEVAPGSSDAVGGEIDRSNPLLQGARR